MVSQFSDGEPVLVRTSGNPRTTAHTLRLNERFIRRHGKMYELNRGHRQSILPAGGKSCSIVHCSILHSHLSGALTKWPVRKRIVVISYSRLCPHL